MNKHLIAVGCVLATAGAATGIVAAAGAQEPQQNVSVTISASSAQITGADALKQGYTKLTFRASGKGERGFALFKLAPGVTRPELEAYAKKVGNPAEAEEKGTFVASGFVAGKQTYTRRSCSTGQASTRCCASRRRPPRSRDGSPRGRSP
jgi:hypothetical protein